MASSFSRKWIYFVRSSSQYVDCGNVLDFERTTPFSISCWVARPSSAWGTRMSFVCKMDSSSRGYEFSNARGAGSPGSLCFRMVNTLSTNLLQRTTYSNDQFDDTGLHHYVATYDGSSSSAGVAIYVDGYLRGSTSEYNSLTATTLNTGSLTFGRAGSTATDYLNGRMEDIAFYNKVLSSAEVLDLFTNGPNDLTIYGPTANLVAWWKMGDGDTYPTLIDSAWNNPYPTIVDASGNGRTGTMSGSSSDITTDTPGGTSSYSVTSNNLSTSVHFGSSTPCSFDSNQAFSFSLWIKTTAFNATAMLRKVDSGVGYYLGINANKLQWYLHDDAGHDINIVYQGIEVSTGAWVHVVCTYDGAGNIKTYRNGALDGSASGTLTGTLVNGGWFSLIMGNYYNGKMDDVSVYTKELSLAEAQWIYNSGAPRRLDDAGAPSNLYAWWRMGDDGGAGKNGTMTNMSAFNLQNMYLPAGSVPATGFYAGAKYPAKSALGASGNIFQANKHFKGRPVIACELGESGNARQYLKRARDLGSGPPAVYTEWVTNLYDDLPPTAPPVGPWGEIKILAEW